MTIRPLHDHVLVKPDFEAHESLSEGGVVVLKGSRLKTAHEGVVVAVGAGRVSKSGNRRPLAVKPGDRVIYRQHFMYEGDDKEAGAIVIKVEDVKHILIPEDDIQAVYED